MLAGSFIRIKIVVGKLELFKFMMIVATDQLLAFILIEIEKMVWAYRGALDHNALRLMAESLWDHC